MTSADRVEAEQLSLASPSGRWVVAAAVLGSGLASLDATVVNIALPAIGRDLQATFEGLQWVITGYTLTLASFILLGGALGDRFGRRRVFVIGTVWFAGASALCALAPSIQVLVGARALEGIGAALLTPGSLAMIQASFAEKERGKAIGAWSAFGGVATAIGPFLGGYLVEGPGWRWLFLINIPVAVIVVVLSERHVPESRDPHAPAHLDLAGAALGAIALAVVTYALIGTSGGFSTTTFMALLVGTASLAAFIVNERRTPNPMIPPSMLRNRQFTATNIVTFVVYAALGGLFFLLVIDLQVVAGFSPVVAGTALLPLTGIMLVLSSRAGDLSTRTGPRLPMTLGPLIAACGALLLLRIGPHASYAVDVLPGVTVFGLGLSLLVAPLTVTVLAAVPAEHAGVASGINNAVARAAGLLAVAVLPLIAGISGDDYQDPVAFAGGFCIALLTCAALLVAGGVIAASLIRSPRPTTGESAPAAPARRRFCAIEGPPLASSRAAVASGARGPVDHRLRAASNSGRRQPYPRDRQWRRDRDATFSRTNHRRSSVRWPRPSVVSGHDCRVPALARTWLPDRTAAATDSEVMGWDCLLAIDRNHPVSYRGNLDGLLSADKRASGLRPVCRSSNGVKCQRFQCQPVYNAVRSR